MMITEPLPGRVWVIFGARCISAGWGIGKATRIKAEGGAAFACMADVTSSSDVQRAIFTTAAHFGRVDVLVNKVGIGKIGRPVELSEQDWDRVTAVNLNPRRGVREFDPDEPSRHHDPERCSAGTCYGRSPAESSAVGNAALRTRVPQVANRQDPVGSPWPADRGRALRAASHSSWH
jgi:NAD(P)-dependent dehydrogenase (short-subunit alcohol dehydrogenase family)